MDSLCTPDQRFARDQPHDRLHAGHFIQEDQGPELAQRTVEWIRGNATSPDVEM